MSSNDPTQGDIARSWPFAAGIAFAAPAALAYNTPPSATFLNQAVALLCWGGFCALLALGETGEARRRPAGLTMLLVALALLLLAALAAPLWAHLPWALALSNGGMLLAATLVLLAGAQMQRAGLAESAFRAFCIGLVVAGVLSCVIGIVQVFEPGWADGNLIARSSLEGRAVGNVRQPNHLSSLLLWSAIAALWLGERRLLSRVASLGLSLLFLFVIVLSASRTGALSVLLLAVWGAIDRRLSRSTRIGLIVAPVLYVGFWLATTAWAEYGHHVFGGETRFSTSGDVSSSRYAIWANTLALIKAHPWTGVGFGEFNFAWTLTPFPDRPTAFFDHTHDLVLQLLVELGIPLGALVIVLLLSALYRALRQALRDGAGTDPMQVSLRRAAFVMVLLILVHSLLEYPLWYAYFLLPAMFAFGLCLADTGAPASRGAIDFHRTRPLLIGSMLLMIAAFAAVSDYMRVVVIFSPPDNAEPLPERIAEGKRSILFTHHADYAAATTAERPGAALASFATASHYLLDARLMQAWAIALHQAGEEDRARYVAARLREFRNDQAEAFFEPCEEKPEAKGKPLPFQCLAPTRALTFEDFR